MFESFQQSRWGRRYGYRDPIYAKGYHRGQDLRAQNKAGTASVVVDVHTLSAGTVVYVGRPNNSLGMTVVIDTGRKRGRYESHSHMAGVVVKVGQKVAADQKLGRNARMNENPGLVTGVHDHMTITDFLDGAWNTGRPEYDPLPFIRDALAAAAGTGDPTPLPTPDPTPDEDEEIEMLFARLTEKKAPNGDFYYAFIAPGYYHEWWGKGAADTARRRYGEPIPVGRAWLDAARNEARASRGVGLSAVIENGDTITFADTIVDADADQEDAP